MDVHLDCRWEDDNHDIEKNEIVKDKTDKAQISKDDHQNIKKNEMGKDKNDKAEISKDGYPSGRPIGCPIGR